MSRPNSVLAVLLAICEVHAITLAELCGDCRTRRIVRARGEAYFRLRAMTFGAPAHHPSLSQIGAWMNRDHSTVLHGLRRYETLLAAERAA